MRDFEPRPYQRLALQHILEHDRCALWAGMGMGKTSTSLAVCDVLYNFHGETEPTLVVAPRRVAENTWPTEARKWRQFSGLEVVPIVGNEKQRTEALKRDAPIFTTNYEQLPWLVDHLDSRWRFRNLIPDEATRLKSFRLRQGGSRARALGKVAHKHARRVLELTGTPAPNGLADLWGQMWFIDAGQRLGRTHQAFMDRWFKKGHDGFSFVALPHAQAEIQALLRDVCLTLDPKDWFDLDEPITNTIRVEMPAKARRIYQDMEREMFASIGGHDVEAFSAASRTIKCLQLANGAAYIDEKAETFEELHDAKLQALESVVEEANGAPVLCAYHFKSDRARIMQAFPHAIDVATKQGLKDAQAGRGRLWIGHPASMGHGIDGLQDHCNIACFFGHWWDLEQRQQFIERIGPVRQAQAGKDRPVFIHNIVAADTVDELVLARHESKREVQGLLMDAMKRRTR
jgi:SNF2 family DNA or RNA helicase